MSECKCKCNKPRGVTVVTRPDLPQYFSRGVCWEVRVTADRMFLDVFDEDDAVIASFQRWDFVADGESD